MMLRRLVRRAAGFAVLAAVLFADPAATSARRQAATLAWTGTVGVNVTWDGTSLPAGAALNFRASGHETVTYTLGGDGTASWVSQFSSRLESPLWTIPASGGGSGQATVDLGFDGGGWGLLIEPLDRAEVQVDYTGKNTIEYERGIQAGLIEMAKALGAPAPSPVQVDTVHPDPTGVNQVLAGGATATTLRGSTTFRTESAFYINGDNAVPATVTLTWTLAKTPVAPRVRIVGAECGCMTSDETETTLRFSAGASPAGGEFSAFTVTSTGEMPAVGVNEGGARPSLELTGTKDTGAVTLTIVYTRNGVRTTSAPYTVNFCAIEKIELADDAHDLSFDDGYRLTVDAKARAWRAGKDVSDELTWDLEKMGAPTTIVAEPSTMQGAHVTLAYRLLPERNADFGRKTVGATTAGPCLCRRNDYIRAFFQPEAHTHPGGETPNWFYYWRQLPHLPEGARGILRYAPAIVGRNIIGTPGAQYEANVELMYVSPPILAADGCQERRTKSPSGPPHPTTGVRATGIDCFIEDVIHEWQHRTDAINWWGTPRGPFAVSNADTLLKDPDLDTVPNDVELAHGCSRFSSQSCPERPFEALSDAEILAYWQGWTWKIGAANRDDWSCGEFSKQWRGRNCGQ